MSGGESLGARMRRLREERGLTLDDVAFGGRPQAPRMTGSWIGQLERGEKYPSLASLRAIALGLDLPPAVFPEYCLALARRALDEREVGVEQALATLTGLEAVLNGDPLPQPLEEFARALEAVPRSDPHPTSAAARSGRARRRRDQGSR